jgi:hypothetical protein
MCFTRYLFSYKVGVYRVIEYNDTFTEGMTYRLEFKYLGTNLTNQNSIQEAVRECLLSFGAESFVFQFAIQIFKNEDIQNYNIACCFVWV